MAFRIYILLLVCLSLSSFPVHGENYETEITICSFNIRGSNMDTGVNAWSNRKKMVIREFSNYQYDIVCMQEPLIDQIQDFLSIGIYEWLGVSGQGTPDSDVFTPIFYNKKKLNVLDYGTFWLSETPDVVSRGWDGKFPRICTWAKFRDIENCRSFYVFNTHLDHVGEVAKLEGARLICRKIKEMTAEEAVFITGDMNSTPETPPIHTFLSEFSNSREIATEKSGPAGTAHSYGKLYPPSQIDYIFVNEYISVTKAITITKNSNPVYMSDHYPIVITADF
ncbi:endonuclease/exonuclease/phosphatase family protein [Bacteroides nordii]|uniref:endonuclease/exonuclease/phosphatase family protein n=1 Tax=Bacteroides nordii TaxID=291645 RepID=UPI002A7FA05F|nr:endonuclease/exonuclease/phosphatase family protein [Bacteroides nordii]